MAVNLGNRAAEDAFTPIQIAEKPPDRVTFCLIVTIPTANGGSITL
jgi:hypothetical protein